MEYKQDSPLKKRSLEHRILELQLEETKSSLKYKLEIASNKVSSLVSDHRTELENFADSKKCSEESLLHEI